MKKLFKINIFISALGFFGSVAFSACSEESKLNEEPQNNPNTLKVLARLSKYSNTRTYVESGPVMSGIFALTYKNIDGNQDYAYVNFNTLANGTGFVTDQLENGKELTWSKVYKSKPYRFTLDNVPAAISVSTSSIQFPTTDENPYKASLLDADSGSNDLLWGVTSLESLGGSIIDFQLDHILSLVQVEITVIDGWEENLDLSDAKVEITNLRQYVTNFNRSTGVVMSNSTSDYSLELTGNNIEWASITPENGKTVYKTKEFVVPPQKLNVGDKRPMLKVTVNEDGVDNIYSGFLPFGMNIEGYPPHELEFLTGKFLTIRTTIDTPDPELVFLPVTYVDWVEKGGFSLTGFMAGLYDAVNFMDLLEAIKTKNENQMKRYGFIDANRVWNFNIWGNLKLNNTIYGYLKGSDINFTFNFNNHTVFSDNDVIETPAKLVGILLGTIQPRPLPDNS